MWSALPNSKKTSTVHPNHRSAPPQSGGLTVTTTRRLDETSSPSQELTHHAKNRSWQTSALDHREEAGRMAPDMAVAPWATAKSATTVSMFDLGSALYSTGFSFSQMSVRTFSVTLSMTSAVIAVLLFSIPKSVVETCT